MKSYGRPSAWSNKLEECGSTDRQTKVLVRSVVVYAAQNREEGTRDDLQKESPFKEELKLVIYTQQPGDFL